MNMSQKGIDVNADGTVAIKTFGLYSLVQDKDYGTHTLEIDSLEPGIMLYTFTFG